jgi:hypothetical protein
MSAIGHTDIISVSTKTGGNGLASMAPINTKKHLVAAYISYTKGNIKSSTYAFSANLQWNGSK